MNGLLDLFPLALFFVLFWKSRYVAFNTEYLSLQTSKSLKAWCCLVIVMRHLFPRIPGGFLCSGFLNVGYLAVTVFFFFSAFGVTKKHRTDIGYAHHFLLRRLPTLFVPYLVASAAWVAVQIGCGEPWSFWKIFFPWQNGHAGLPYSWYIFAVSLFYVAFWVLMKCFGKNWKAMLVGISIYWILYVCFCSVLDYSWVWIISSGALLWGMVCAYKEQSLTRFLQAHIKYLLPVLLAGLQLLLWQGFIQLFITHSRIFCMIVSSVTVVTVLLFSAQYSVGNKILAFLSNIYLEIYLVHGIFIETLLPGRPLNIISNPFMLSLVCLAGSIGGGYLLHRLCQKPLQVYQRWLEQH